MALTVQERKFESSEKELLSFGLKAPDSTKVEINDVNITIQVLSGTDLSSLVASFTSSDKSTVYVNGVLQTSGVTVNNFSNQSVEYVVVSEDGTKKSYFVNVIFYPIISYTTQSSCEKFDWNGKSYVESGTYTYTTKNSSGTDSIAKLILTMNTATNSSISMVACSSYALNGKTYTQSGKYINITTNVKGCDSIITLYLTIINPVKNTITHTACGSYT
jgi:hypothetical protein